MSSRLVPPLGKLFSMQLEQLRDESTLRLVHSQPLSPEVVQSLLTSLDKLLCNFRLRAVVMEYALEVWLGVPLF